MNKILIKKTGRLFSYSFLLLFALLFSFSDISFSQSSCVEGEVKIGSRIFSNIQSAISNSSSGDTIELGSGSFNEILEINRKNNLSIQSSCFPEIKRLRVRRSNNFHLKGVSIKGEKGAPFSARLLNVKGAKIENLHVFNSGSTGIWLSEASDVLLSQLSIYNNSTGVVLDNASELLIKDSLIYGNKRDGIFFNEALSLIAEDSQIYNNQNGGIFSHQTQEVLRNFIGLNRVELYSNESYGIRLQSNISFRISNSRISDHPLFGLEVNKTGVSSLNKFDRVEGTVIEGNGKGIIFKSPQDLELIRNEIIENEGFGFLYSNPSNIKPLIFLSQNKFTGNKGVAEQGVSSRDLSSYSSYLDNADSGNETSLNSEGLGVGNYRPQAFAGEDVLFSQAGDKLSLSASGSYDLDGDSLSYTWSVIKKPSSSTAGFESSDKPLAFFSPDVLGDYELELEVSDGKQTSTDKILISSNNIRPKAQAGVDELVNTGDEVQLDGTASSDTKGTSLNYSWSFIKKPIGSVAEIKSRRAKRPRFTVDKAGDYEIELELSDGLLSNKNRVLISTLNIPPQVEIAKPVAPALSKALSLKAEVLDDDLNNQSDEGRKVTYKWSVLSAPVGDSSYSFSNPNSKDTSFTALRPGDYVLQLIADDEEFYGVDTVLLSYGNQAPVAKTGRNIPNAITNKKVDLNGSGSTDPEGKALSYEWSFDLKPQGSMAVIGDAKKQQAFFMPDKTGVYRVALTVSDGFLSSKDVIKVTVKEPKNQAPTLAKIGNKSVKIGEELSFKLMGSDKDNGDIIRYTVSPFPLYENMRFNTKTGEFYFKPRGHQAGEYNLKFTVIDNLGAEKSRNVKITVNALKKKGKTSVKGRVLEANAMANSQTELALAGVDVRLSVDGNNMYMSMTDNEGYFTINDIPKGEEYIIQIATSGITLNGKPKYGDFHEQIEVIEKAENVITRPFYMPLVDTNGVAEITANKATKLVNTAIKAELDVPANVSRMNGMAYTGDISLSEVPKALAPIALPESLRGTATLLTLQPAGLRFTTPVRVTFPNKDNFPAGTQLDIYSVNPDTGLFEISGKGRVNADRTKIETISGGITAATWHTPSPPDPDPNCPNNLCSDENDIDCESCKAGSDVDLMTGVLREEHTLASYRSLNQQRVLSLGYNSKSAHPYKVILSMTRSYPIVSAIPPKVSSKVRFQGLDIGTEAVTDSSSLSENEVQPFVLKNSVDIPFPKTGIYRLEQIATSHYPESKFLGLSLKATSVIDYTKSPYGKGWAVVNLHRLYIDEGSRDILLVRGNSYQAQFRAFFPNLGEVRGAGGTPDIGGIAPDPIIRPPTYLSPRGDYSNLKAIPADEPNRYNFIPAIGYIRTTKEGMLYHFNAEG